MRRNVEEVVCDRCGKKITGETFVNQYDVETDVGEDGKYLAYEYHELCWRCSGTVQRRLEEAGPLKGAPKGPSDE